MNDITVKEDGHLEHARVIQKINTFIQQSVRAYEDGEVLKNDKEALAIYNIFVIDDEGSTYEVEEEKWNLFKQFIWKNKIEKDAFNAVEKDVLSMVLENYVSYSKLASLERELDSSESARTEMILQEILNRKRIGNDSGTSEEDVLLTEFLEPLLMEPFLREIPETDVHGNGYPLPESYKRKVKVAKKYQQSAKGVRGRAPDRTMKLNVGGKAFSQVVIEVKTEKNVRRNKDFVKIASLMKDVLDSAFGEGIDNSYFTTGILIESSACKIFKLEMPIKKLYCKTQVSSFNLPTKNDSQLVDKLERLVTSMSHCQQMIHDSIRILEEQLLNSNDYYDIYSVDSYPSPLRHDSFHN